MASRDAKQKALGLGQAAFFNSSKYKQAAEFIFVVTQRVTAS